MDAETKAKRRRVISWILAGLVAAMGLWSLLVFLLEPGWRFIAEGNYWAIFFVLVFPVALLVWFSCYCLYVAYRIRNAAAPEDLRRVSFICGLVVFWVVSIGLRRGFTHTHVALLLNLINTVALILAGLAYLLAFKALTRVLGLDAPIDWQRRARAAKRYFGLMAFFVFGLFMSVGVTIHERVENLDVSTPWDFVLLPLGVVVAWSVYRTGVFFAMRGKPAGSLPVAQGPAHSDATDQEQGHKAANGDNG